MILKIVRKYIIQLVNNDGDKVGKPEVRSVVKTHDAEINESVWYEAYIAAKKSKNAGHC